MAARANVLTRPFTGHTAWARNLAAPVRDFLQHGVRRGARAAGRRASPPCCGPTRRGRTPTSRSGPPSSRSSSADDGISMDLRDWVNEGLMTFFFLVVGLEAKREFDVGPLRERRRLALPLMGAVGGMALAVAIYLAFNAGGAGAGGWGAAMSTDTAFALGVLALVAPGAHAPAGPPADDRRLRRPRRAARDRHRLHRLGRPGRARRRARACSAALAALRYAPIGLAPRRSPPLLGARRSGSRCSSRASTR